MEGEKIKIFGHTYTHYYKAYKSPYFQPDILDLRSIRRPYWYINNALSCFENVF